MMQLDSPQPSFPQEIVDEIVDHIPTTWERDTLRACTLVSCAWFSRAYTRLWRSIHVSYTDISPTSSVPRLLHTSAGLRSTIRVLEVDGYALNSYQATLDSAYFTEFLDLLENLDILRMQAVCLSIPDYTPLQWSRERPLQELSLSKLIFRSFEHVVGTLAFFAKVPVERLSFDQVSLLDYLFSDHIPTLAEDDDPEDEPLSSADVGLFCEWRVAELIYTSSLSSIILDVIRVSEVRHLRTLELPRFHSIPMHERFVALAEVAGPYVTHLRINLTSPYYEPGTWEQVTATWKALSHFTSLETLELDWQDFALYAEPESRRTWLPTDNDRFTKHTDVLQYVRPTVQRLVFRFATHPWSTPANDPWTEYIQPSRTWPSSDDFHLLEQMLLSFRELQSLIITRHICPSKDAHTFLTRSDEPPSESDMETIRTLLPALDRSGKLRFHMNKPSYEPPSLRVGVVVGEHRGSTEGATSPDSGSVGRCEPTMTSPWLP